MADQRAGITVTKGHGTQNDFVIVTDPTGALDLTDGFVQALCDRQRGLGADGVLRVARPDALCVTGVLDEMPAGVTSHDWFMDYRNADGSIAEMCGNGVRVFAHHLVASGLVDSAEFVVGTRAGARPVVVHHADAVSADVSVTMGPVTIGETSTATLPDRSVAGVAVDVGNPHLACIVDDVAGFDFTRGVEFDDDVFPHGVNLEVITAPQNGEIDMRVLERGVGETRSCGTGTVAAAAAALHVQGKKKGSMIVHIPGGSVSVTIDGSSSTLRGPSRIVAHVDLLDGWDAN